MHYLLTFTVGFLIVYFLTPWLKDLSCKTGFVDRPTKRKDHAIPVPLLGGVGIFFGFICGYAICVRQLYQEVFSVFIASLLVFAISLLDDWYKTKGKEFPVLPRFLVHVTAAVIVYNAGIVFRVFQILHPAVYNTARLAAVYLDGNLDLWRYNCHQLVGRHGRACGKPDSYLGFHVVCGCHGQRTDPVGTGIGFACCRSAGISKIQQASGADFYG